MEKTLAKAILPLVNSQDNYTILQEYIDARIEAMRSFLENTKDHNKILEIQGSIAELRRFQTLRDQALESAK